MIIWLASYPKSGNTWVRAVIVSYFFTKDGKLNFKDLSRIPDYPNRIFLNENFNINNLKDGEIYKYWETSQKKIFEKGKAKFLKTHNILGTIEGCSFTKSNYTLGVIHIIRDPRNIITSLKNHLNFKDYEKTYEYMKSKDAFIKGEDSARFAFLGSWRSHYKSWMSNTTLKRITIKYEDMEKKPYETFKTIISFINTICGFKGKIDNIKLKTAIDSSSFSKMEKAETSGEFNENVMESNNKKIKFFNLGAKNKWQNILPKDIANNMCEYYKDDLENLNYE